MPFSTGHLPISEVHALGQGIIRERVVAARCLNSIPGDIVAGFRVQDLSCKVLSAEHSQGMRV